MADVQFEYKDWSQKLEVLAGTSWYEMSDIIKFLATMSEMTNKLYHKSFASPSDIERLAGMLCALKCNAPFSREKRFCADKYYLCEFLDENEGTLTEVGKLFNFLSVFDCDAFKSNTDEKFCTQIDTNVDVRNLYQMFVNGVLNSAITCYNREKFESSFRLVWSKEWLEPGASYSKGVYANWSAQTEALAFTKWYKLNELVKFVEGARKLAFSKTKSKTGKFALSELAVPSPYSRNRRFTDEEYYVSEFHFPNALKLQQLCNDLHHAMIDGNNLLTPTMEVIREDGISILNGLISNHTAFDRTSFEKMHGLVWTLEASEDMK